MALTISVVRRTVFGNMRVVTADLTFDNSYPTNGEPFVAADVGLTALDLVLHNTSVGGFLVDYDYTNRAFLVRQGVANHSHASTGLTITAHGAHTHNLHLNNADVADGATTRINAGNDLLGANTGADLLVTGVTGVGGVGGIVQATDGVHTLGGTTSATATAPAGNSETAAVQLANTSNVLSTLVLRAVVYGY